MTEPADFAPTESVLPGLEPPARTASRLERATRRTIARLEADGLVDESHAMLLQLLLDLAEVVDAGRRSGKASAVAMAAAQMLAAYAVIVPDHGGGGDSDEPDAFDQLAEDLRRAAAVGHTPG